METTSVGCGEKRCLEEPEHSFTRISMADDLNPIRVLIVDDHPLMREGIASAFRGQADITVCAQATNGREAIACYRRHRPDVTLMDLQMPEMSGQEAIQAIRIEFPTAKIVVLTTYKGDVQVLAALEAGAVGYILKSMVRKELLETVRAVHAGRRRI